MKKSIHTRTIALSLAVAVSAMTVTSCESLTKTQKGAGIGAVAGGALGALIGKKAGNTAAGAIIGAAVGGTAGAFIGKYMERQAEEIEREVPGATVEQYGEGLVVQFDSKVLFDFDSYALRDESKDAISQLAEVLNKYDSTEVVIEGHTDNVGSDTYNQKLSRQRAQAVEDYALSLGIDPGRLSSKGLGEAQPIASNETEAGRQDNRRVQFVIVANEALKKEAEEQASL
ncbi:outer membrane protein OmpA-like peptidoglycan-associated protein [Anseongella ginsenosidimutans]|uniref:Outer membrane protein OmpA-like peptidoglycan-associated protein n=1 Tax=Anseongella ginsenosidimutans TaxID=496056 RepID=A0A4R3KUS8_9SPHI|nr:OmpA family protein [Anseongella ginsenosidimutans]QEC51818.1 OmpA family protein [Anseongella ginsenosidimutans]TCS89189.1 outer membrane protein OmpA-like peptidoglycan-associated protein [Anseongella ginsenosidimutans]